MPPPRTCCGSSGTRARACRGGRHSDEVETLLQRSSRPGRGEPRNGEASRAGTAAGANRGACGAACATRGCWHRRPARRPPARRVLTRDGRQARLAPRRLLLTTRRRWTSWSRRRCPAGCDAWASIGATSWERLRRCELLLLLLSDCDAVLFVRLTGWTVQGNRLASRKTTTTLACKLDKDSGEIARDTTKVPECTQWLQGRGVVSSLCPGSAGLIPNLQRGQTKPQSALIEPFGRLTEISWTKIGNRYSMATNGLDRHSQPPCTCS